MSAIRLRLEVTGVVQGVGFRPFVYRIATSRGLTGWVLNGTAGVRIEVEGGRAAVDAFAAALANEAPPAAAVDSLRVTEVAAVGGDGFTILASDSSEPLRPSLPPDLATCAACRAEVLDPTERRHRYPFTNCTNCGPRYSIIEHLPYDRPRTSMRGFPLCPECAREYRDQSDRRFHAQPIACPACGPRLAWLRADGTREAEGDAALRAAVAAIEAGRIVALKGLGGFQLLADAASPAAVARLRRRKRRPAKPLAVVFPDLATVRAQLHLGDAEAAALQSPAAPILLLEKRGDGGVTTAVAPGNPRLGVMLPYTPLHALLAAALGRPFVCTSGNVSGDPMCTHTSEVIERLGHVVDAVLTHDRPIVRPVDDSVARLDGDDLVVLRRARGYAPRPLTLDVTLPRVLAVGGHLKSTVAFGMGDQVVLSPHIGDLSGAMGIEVFERAIEDLIDFLEFIPDVVACDLHPDYASSLHAEVLAERFAVPLLRVQHHWAHVAAAAAEHGLSGELTGISWDGTGYGPDGTVWGGETLVGHGGTFRRAAHLLPFPLAGGERAVEEPRRAALGLLHVLDPARRAAEAGRWFSASETAVLTRMLSSGLNTPHTSSMGRLFDGVAALLGLGAVSSFEGEAAMALEFAADRAAANDRVAYAIVLAAGEPAVADWRPLVEAVLADRDSGLETSIIAGRFHRGLAAHAVDVALRAGCERVVLTGGCLQNRRLAAEVRAQLEANGFRVYTHSKVPPNDGGIAFGQVWAAGHALRAAAGRAAGGCGEG